MTESSHDLKEGQCHQSAASAMKPNEDWVVDVGRAAFLAEMKAMDNKHTSPEEISAAEVATVLLSMLPDDTDPQSASADTILSDPGTTQLSDNTKGWFKSPNSVVSSMGTDLDRRFNVGRAASYLVWMDKTIGRLSSSAQQKDMTAINKALKHKLFHTYHARSKNQSASFQKSEIPTWVEAQGGLYDANEDLRHAHGEKSNFESYCSSVSNLKATSAGEQADWNQTKSKHNERLTAAETRRDTAVERLAAAVRSVYPEDNGTSVTSGAGGQSAAQLTLFTTQPITRTFLVQLNTFHFAASPSPLCSQILLL